MTSREPLRSGMNDVSQNWKLEFETCTEPRAALGGDLGGVLLNDPVGNGEPQPGAAPRPFGGEERIIDARQVLGGDANAIVPNLNAHAGVLGPGGNAQAATIRHRILGIKKK